MTAKRLTHTNDRGEAHMVDVSSKCVTAREAVAEGELHTTAETRDALFANALKKGDAIAVARIAGIQAAKRTPELIPLCHAIALGAVTIDIEPMQSPPGARVRATVKAADRTGAEMEALTAASVALLTLYDMLKALQKDMRIERLRLRRKRGGKSGDLELS